MRDLDPKETFKGLGERVAKKPEQPKPEWQPVAGTKGTIERGLDGKLRTNIPTPK